MPFGSSKRFDRIETQLRAVYDQLQHITEVIDKMATNPPVSQAQFTTDLAALQTNLGKMITDVQADIAALKAQIAAGQAPDFSALDATVQSMSTVVSAEDTAAEGDLDPPSASADAAKK